MAKVAFLGTGLLGSGIIEGMLRRGDAVTVWNRTRAKAEALVDAGARVAATPAEAVAEASRVHLTLSDDEAVEAVIGEFVASLPAGTVIADHTTTSPRGALGRVERLNGAGVKFLHAPVFMSPPMARESSGLMMVSGPEPVYAAIAGDLAKMTGEVWYLGENGATAAAYKLFGNSMIFVLVAGLADVFTMAKGLGITPLDALEVFSKFQVGGMLKSRGEKMARGDFAATFELTMARKDLRLMLDAAGGPTAVLAAIGARMDEAISEGHGRDDVGAVAAKALG
jgi:3-hydroxyisobutyrate dehydrogenase